MFSVSLWVFTFVVVTFLQLFSFDLGARIATCELCSGQRTTDLACTAWAGLAWPALKSPRLPLVTVPPSLSHLSVQLRRTTTTTTSELSWQPKNNKWGELKGSDNSTVKYPTVETYAGLFVCL